VFVASVLFTIIVGSDNLSYQDAAILLLLLFAYLAWVYWSEKVNAAPSAVIHQAEVDEVTLVPKSAGLSALATVLGLVCLIAGSKVLLRVELKAGCS
jgi:cation:H+ antiporter